MKKIALFVEGKTEQIFSVKLIEEFIGKRGFLIDTYKFLGGKKTERNPFLIKSQGTNDASDYYFVIYDCGGDNRVQSDIRDRMESLYEESFSMVIGIRDVFPNDINKLTQYLYFGLPLDKVPIKNILAVNEVESWFLAEEDHFLKISEKLTIELVNSIAEIDIRKDSTEVIPHPSSVLKEIYIKGRTTYDKSEPKVKKTVNVLNYDNLYVDVRKRNDSLNDLMMCLDRVFEVATSE